MSLEDQNVLQLLQRYRRDRRVLLTFLLSGNLIKKVAMPPGAVSLDDVDLDQVSIDYALNCAKKGEMLDLSEAIRVHYDSLDHPTTDDTGSIQDFFLATTPESSGPAPSRMPPQLPTGRPITLASLSAPVASSLSSLPAQTHLSPSSVASSASKLQSVHSLGHQELTIDDIEDFEDDEDDEEVNSIRNLRCQRNDANDLLLGFPSFATGLMDDELRETAYEILVASAGAAGGLIVPSKEKKKERKTRLLKKLSRSKSENVVDRPQHAAGLVGLLETMRVQMEISEAMDIRTRKGLLSALVGKVGKRMDTLLIPLELLSCISRTEFSDKKAFLKWQRRQLNILEEGLINYPVVGFGESGCKAKDLRSILRKIEESESLPPSAGEVQRTECLRSLRDVTMVLAERPARGDLTGEVCHWADGYPLNVRIYEKMLHSVFDILDEGKLTEEVEEILELLRATWRILGITETIHDTCYSWILFRQFAITGEQRMLQLAIQQLRKIPLKEQRGPHERLHLKSLWFSFKSDEGAQNLSFLQSFLMPIQKWTDKKLADYHVHFSEGPTLMSELVTAAVIIRRLLVEESDQKMQSATLVERSQMENYISSSVKSAFTRIVHAAEAKTGPTHEHILASLAEEAQRLLKKDATMFSPIFSERHPQAPVISASLVHKLYGYKLRPFLDQAEHLTEDVASVLPAAASLECYIMSVISSSCEEALVQDCFKEKLTPYQVEDISGTLVMRWVNSQLSRISGWIERALQQERWDPISPQQRHGNSVVEVYRIVEETVDQFFTLKVPMRILELNGLFRGLDNAFKEYTQNIVGKIASKEDLIPPIPILTRHKKETAIKALVRKEVPDYRLPDGRKSSQINVLSTPSLCVRLNTLHYAITQLNKLEESIWEQWTRQKSSREKILIKRPMDGASRDSSLHNQKNAFDGSRKDINAAIDKICEFMGTKIVFWDMREQFIENLYKNSVSQSRAETVIEALDKELNQLCDVIVEPLRDRTVTGLLQASVEGLLRILLDGGPSRVFSPSDAKLLEDDLQSLKEFFISGGDGLPRGTVENFVSRVRPIITLHSFESRELVADLKGTSQGSKSRFGADSETLIRILCHRSDSEASQFLKKQYKIPKSVA